MAFTTRYCRRQIQQPNFTTTANRTQEEGNSQAAGTELKGPLSLITHVCGWRPPYTRRQGLEATAAWYRSPHPQQ
ncbi:hypothetical protein CA830_04095 [Burkholderia multivorans]|uniref:Uncharacterized protein n=1 Tax=Burkholderia multivorans TaxID=87883 RepID=A0A2S9MX16_9BURK|nr:hypothetical protein CA830_04095 [Burkholderia multivorans]PRF01467.1 hypothetical protein C6Q07_22900 [Burkholderia multivorans]PRF63900.1 hypothetical protein C6Q15_07475 [Burkholderia multivorans]